MYLKKPYFGNYELGNKFGFRIHPIEKIEKMHNGVDIKIPFGTRLYAPMDGFAFCRQDQFAGKHIIIESITEQGTKVQFIFCHLSEYLIKIEQTVVEWQDIALSGNSGMSTGAHLHLGVKIFDQMKKEFIFDDPLKYFDFGVAV